MKNLIVIIASLVATSVNASESFENAGFVNEVSTATNIVTIDHQRYQLANAIEQDGTPVIFQLNNGSFVSFSGITQSPNWIIKTLHVYPPTLTSDDSDSAPAQESKP